MLSMIGMKPIEVKITKISIYLRDQFISIEVIMKGISMDGLFFLFA